MYTEDVNKHNTQECNIKQDVPHSKRSFSPPRHTIQNSSRNTLQWHSQHTSLYTYANNTTFLSSHCICNHNSSLTTYTHYIHAHNAAATVILHTYSTHGSHSKQNTTSVTTQATQHNESHNTTHYYPTSSTKGHTHTPITVHRDGLLPPAR